MLDVIRIRSDFPVLSRQVYGKPLVYLDNAATTQKPRPVVQALVDYYYNSNSNVYRAVHALGMEATEQYEEARAKIARFIGAPRPENIIFTRNTTEGINLVAYAWATAHVKAGDEILLSEMEHHSNLVPWQRISKETGARLRFIPVNEEGTLEMSHLSDLINQHTRLVSITHMSNVLGTINPVEVLAKAAHQVGAFTLVDGAQSVPHMPVNVEELGCDFLALSGHKMLGPTGIGALYVRDSVLEELDPLFRGGEMVGQVWYDHATWADPPMRFEAGTPNIADAIALGAAVDYLQALGMENVRHHEEELTRYAIEALQPFEEMILYGPKDTSIRGGIVSFNFPDIHPHDLGTFLDREGIAIRAGHHCAMPLVRKLGVVATARASFYVYNTMEEIDVLVDALKRATRYFKRDTTRTIT